eukprot:6127225-Prymnesium_polylepis.1
MVCKLVNAASDAILSRRTGVSDGPGSPRAPERRRGDNEAPRGEVRAEPHEMAPKPVLPSTSTLMSMRHSLARKPPTITMFAEAAAEQWDTEFELEAEQIIEDFLASPSHRRSSRVVSLSGVAGTGPLHCNLADSEATEELSMAQTEIGDLAGRLALGSSAPVEYQCRPDLEAFVEQAAARRSAVTTDSFEAAEQQAGQDAARMEAD